MTDRELELRLKKAVEACTPDVLDKVMAECDTYTDNNIVPFKKKNNFSRFIAVAAMFLIVAGIGIFSSMGMRQVASIISLEINPSIELRINKNEEVLEAKAMNADAEEILAGMKLKGTDIHTATNAIVGSLLKHGYINELANSILLSVEDTDMTRGEELQHKLSGEIDAMLSSASINASILSQYVEDHSVDEVSETYQISHGKAALIESILAVNNTYEFEALASLSVNELNLLTTSDKNKVTDVESTGKVSDGAYIGTEKANQIAFEEAGIEESEILNLEVEFDYEYNTMIYEVEFIVDTVEYEYDIDAKTGEILGLEVEYDF